MSDSSGFSLWLEFEEYAEMPEGAPEYDPADDFANIAITLADGRRYCLNVWTFAYVRRARYTGPGGEEVAEPAEYLVTPDLLVERLDRPTLERTVRSLLASGGLRDEWLSPEADTCV